MAELIQYRDSKDFSIDDVLTLYRANDWSSAGKPDLLYQGLLNSDSIITAWQGDRMLGLANAILDGFLVVYYPHIVVHPDFQRQGIGREMMIQLMRRYEGFHQHSILADKDAVGFFQQCGFQRSVCPAMWIYDGEDH